MKGIECAFEGALGRDPELKTSRNGKPYAMMNIVVTVGQDADGNDIGQWLRVSVFGPLAQDTAATARKGSKLYVEGSLTLDSWQAADGEKRWGLSVMAWKAIVLGQIGQRRPKRPVSGPDDTKPVGNGTKYERPFNDSLPF
jgi:single-strand DNA-binding protein